MLPTKRRYWRLLRKSCRLRGETPSENLFISPRDSQKYVINFKPNSTNPERNVAMHEKEGYGGKKLVAFESKWTKEVDDAELQTLLTTK